MKRWVVKHTQNQHLCNTAEAIKKNHYRCSNVEVVEFVLEPINSKFQHVPRNLTPEMRELMLRIDEFTVDEMWVMLWHSLKIIKKM